MDAGKEHKKEGLKPVEKQVIWLFVILGLVFLTFIVSYGYFKPSNSFKYEGFSVYKSQIKGVNVDFYFIPVQISGGKATNIVLRSDPRTMGNVSFDLSPQALGGITKIWLTTNGGYDSYAIIATKEIGTFTSSIGVSTSYALTEKKAGDFPVMTCANATKSIKVIDLRIANSTSVHSEGNCIIVEGETYPQMILAADKFVVEWLKKLYRAAPN